MFCFEGRKTTFVLHYFKLMPRRDNTLQPTLLPLSLKIVLGFAHDHEIGKSTAASQFIQKAIDCMPEDVKQKYIRIYNNIPKKEKSEIKESKIT